MLIFSFILLIVFHALMSKKHISFLILCSAAALCSPPSETLSFSSCPFKAPLLNIQSAMIRQLTHT